MKIFKVLLKISLVLLLVVVYRYDNKTKDNKNLEPNPEAEYVTNIKETKNVFKKLEYSPNWEGIPNIKEFKNVFFKTTGQHFDDKVNECAYKLLSLRKEYIKTNKGEYARTNNMDNNLDDPLKLLFYEFNSPCYNALELDLNYLKKGNKLTCKRSEFFRNLIEDGSSWLLSNNYMIDNWFWDKYLVSKDTEITSIKDTIYDPYIENIELFEQYEDIIDHTKFKYIDVCNAVAKGYTSLFYNKTVLNDKTKKIEKDTNIAQSKLTLENKNKDENDYIIELDYNNDGKKELIHKTYLYGEQETGCPRDDGVIYFNHCDCFANCSNFSVSSCDIKVNRDYVAYYENNIEEVKKYLKTPNLVIKDLDHFNDIKEKFGGKDLDYECSCYIKDFAENDLFFTFKDRTYIIDLSERYSPLDYGGYVTYIKNGKCNTACYIKRKHFSKTTSFNEEKNNFSNYAKALITKSFPIYYVNEDNYLYDKSLLYEIKKMSYKISYSYPLVRDKIEEYLKRKAKKICDVDLDNIQYKPENKAIILKLMEDNGEDVALDKTKVVKNNNIPETQKKCGLNEENERCTLYILNNSDKEIKTRYFYPLAAKATGTLQEDIVYINDKYSDAIIKPNHFAEVNIPIPYYLFYLDETGTFPYIR